MSATDYSPTFYDTIADGCRQSAEIVVPLILDDLGFEPETVIDVGCGQGWWGAEFAKAGAKVTGIDGAYVPGVQLDDFIAHDLDETLPDLPKADVVVCLEVAEHLTLNRASSFVADLCRLGEVVVFSAATPHQTGAGHINLQWPSWWAVLFRVHQRNLDGRLRWRIWDDDRVEPWYRQNLMVAYPTPIRQIGPLDVIHPIIHEWGR